ncbi:MAG: hypothetical protein C4530_22815 [Desulfobacteraceae bacterium]|nr:MAG: hypothetical protein C4530_22815 [Desulfobacteraceae bacterium]
MFRVKRDFSRQVNQLPFGILEARWGNEIALFYRSDPKTVTFFRFGTLIQLGTTGAFFAPGGEFLN